MSTFYVISQRFLSKLAKLINHLIILIIIILLYFNYIFHLLISSIARINAFSGCSHYLETSQVIYDANRLIGFSVMEISIEINRSFRAICKIIIFVNRILILLPALRLALIF